MAGEIIDINLEGDSEGSVNEETNNVGKGVEIEGPTNGKGVDGEVHVEEGQKESIVEDYYELGQDFTTQVVLLEKEDEAGVEKECASASKSHNVADDHNDDFNGNKKAESDERHDDPIMDILELTDTEDEEAMEAIRKVKCFCYNLQGDNAGSNSYHDGGVNAVGLSTPRATIHDNGDEIQSDAEYRYISIDEDDGSDADHAFRKSATDAVYEEVEDALPDIRLGMILDICKREVVGDFGSNIWEKIVASWKGSKRCRVLWLGGTSYEVEKEDKGKFIVDINRKTCTCRCWNMTSIPCKHAVSVMKLRKEKDEGYVNHCSQIAKSKKRPKNGSTSSTTTLIAPTQAAFPSAEPQYNLAVASSPPQEQNKRGEAKRKKSSSQLSVMAKDRQGKGG
ncbi:hypothetical protein SLEP1_g6702 [Rubroshorea leprosula]|uniref:SWIM-type domain-containing protein n=1 Tax=Rubroshorea leprosula TaxID=152421 RepID=A0AAV5I6W3_9ROSI|nr:hypothetical protein SLEP1_g6702 [Rubroshorea leprosula]